VLGLCYFACRDFYEEWSSGRWPAWQALGGAVLSVAAILLAAWGISVLIGKVKARIRR